MLAATAWISIVNPVISVFLAVFTVEQLTMSLEDEREQIKALKRKHTSNTKDLQRQIAHCKRSDLNTLSSLFPSPSFVYLFHSVPPPCLHSVVCAVSLCGFFPAW